MSAAPPVSVLMPVHDAEKYLAPALDSILAQTFRDFEFIVVDDGSTDRSARILDDYARLDPRIRLVRQPNAGITKALNAGLAVARGALVARMDADDIALPNRLAIQVAFLRANPDVVCMAGGVRAIDARGRVLFESIPPEDDATLQEMALSGACPFVHPAVMMRRDAVEAVGGYDEGICFGQDLDLWLRLGERGRLAGLPRIVLLYRRHEGTVTERRRDEQLNYTRVAVERAYARRSLDRRYQPIDVFRGEKIRAARHECSMFYSWLAYHRGDRATALIYGLRAIRWAPWRQEGWRMMARLALRPPRTATGATRIG